jgi:hypothetical protein
LVELNVWFSVYWKHSYIGSRFYWQCSMFGSQSIGSTRILVPDYIGRAQCLVLSLLEADSIGRGQFLLHNSIGSVQFFSLTNLYLQNPIDRIL